MKQIAIDREILIFQLEKRIRFYYYLLLNVNSKKRSIQIDDPPVWKFYRLPRAFQFLILNAILFGLHGTLLMYRVQILSPAPPGREYRCQIYSSSTYCLIILF